MINMEDFTLDEIIVESGKPAEGSLNDDSVLENTDTSVVEEKKEEPADDKGKKKEEPVVENSDDTTATPVTEEAVTVEENSDAADAAENYDEQSIETPKHATEINQATYKNALNALKQSFKEATDVMAMLADATIVESPTMDERQEQFTEEAIFESYCDGPIYEAVEKENKKEIKAIARKIRKKLVGTMRGIKWYTPEGKPAGNRIGIFDAYRIAKHSGELKLVAWQMVCILIPKKGTNFGTALEDINEEFKDILGDYVLKSVKLKMNVLTGLLGVVRDKDVSETNPNEKPALLTWHVLIVDEKDAKTPKEISVDVEESEVKKVQEFMAQK